MTITHEHHDGPDDCRALLLEARGIISQQAAQLAAQERVISKLNHENDALRAERVKQKVMTDRDDGDWYSVWAAAGMIED